jgi:phosphatidylglycerophosphate synthase
MSESPYQPTERRPIASRSWPIFQWTATTLVRWRVSPNAISLAGMFCAIAGGGAFAATAHWPDGERWLWLAAGLLIQIRLIANLLDGMVAVESGTASAVGELYNDVPDRVSDAALLVGAGYAVGGDIALGFTAACVALFTAYVRAVGKAAGAPQEFCGPMAKQQRMALLTVIAVYCGVMPADWQPRWQVWGLSSLALSIIIVLGVVTAMRRLFRIAANLKRTR